MLGKMIFTGQEKQNGLVLWRKMKIQENTFLNQTRFSNNTFYGNPIFH